MLFVEAVFYRPNKEKVSDSIGKQSDLTNYDRLRPNNFRLYRKKWKNYSKRN